MIQQDIEKVRRLCSWIDMCIVTFSPWLFNREPIYTVVGDVNINYNYEDQENTLIKMIREKLGTQIQTDKTRYKLWEQECGFKFTWESLTLNIVEIQDTIQVYFSDNQERRSKYTFYLSNLNDDTGPEYTPHEHNEIPWLLCVS
jgi:hypothetical protein